MSSEGPFNPQVNGLFRSLSNSRENPPALFPTGYPEHQFEGKYSLQPGDVFVEAGAFWGRYGLIASHRVGSQGKVILIEGNPENLKVINEVLQTYELRNVIVVDGIVWSEDGYADFLVWGNPAGSRKALPSDSQNYPDYIIKVRSWTLDSLLSSLNIKKVDLLSCDIEGAEYEMVKGAKRYLQEKRILNVALCAYHEPGMPEKILSFLRDVGYDVFYSGPIPQYGGIVYGHV